MVERTLAWLTRGTNRKLRYRGVERNQLWWSHRCAGVNLQRLVTLGLTRRQGRRLGHRMSRRTPHPGRQCRPSAISFAAIRGDIAGR